MTVVGVVVLEDGSTEEWEPNAVATSCWTAARIVRRICLKPSEAPGVTEVEGVVTAEAGAIEVDEPGDVSPEPPLVIPVTPDEGEVDMEAANTAT